MGFCSKRDTYDIWIEVWEVTLQSEQVEFFDYIEISAELLKACSSL